MAIAARAIAARAIAPSRGTVLVGVGPLGARRELDLVDLRVVEPDVVSRAALPIEEAVEEVGLG